MTLPWGSGVDPRYLFAPCSVALAAVVFALVAPGFASIGNATNVLGQVGVLALLAAGQMVVMVVRGFDISVGAVAAASSTVAALAFNVAGPAGLMVAVMVGAGFGLVNGLVIAVLKVQPIIATLGTLLAARAIARLVSDDGQAVAMHDGAAFVTLTNGAGFGLPLVIWLVIGALCWLAAFLAWTTQGRRIFMAGSDPQAAELVGLRVTRTTCIAYVITGAMAGLAGLVLTLRSGAGLPAEGAGLELQAIAAAIIGGTALAGGSGSVFAAVAGALFIQVVLTGLNLSGIAPFVAQMLLGVLIVGSGFLEALARKLAVK